MWMVFVYTMLLSEALHHCTLLNITTALAEIPLLNHLVT